MTGRFYTVDGEPYPSVTTVIGQALPNPAITAWKLRIGEAEAERISLEATTHGTDTHALIEAVNRGRHLDLDAEQHARIAPYCAWHEANVETVIAVEKLVISRQHRYAGTADVIVVLRGDTHPAIVDFKTSKTPLALPEWRLQLAAYAIAAEEHLGLICRRRVVVRLSRDMPDTLHVHELPEDTLTNDRQTFLALLNVWRWKQSTGEIRAPVSKSLGRISFRDGREQSFGRVDGRRID